jgi:VWFA-related protein
MRCPRLPALVVILSSLVAWCAPVAAQTTDRAVFVSVADGTGAPVTGLGMDSFAVKEDGKTREVLRVSRAVQPVDVVILIDNSTAASRAINDLRKALTAFVTRMSAAGNPVALVTIADRPTGIQDYTTSSAALVRAVERIFAQPGSGTTLLDAIRDVSRGLQKRDSERRLILAITTQGTDFSNPNYQRSLEDIADSGATFSALVLTDAGSDDLSTEEARSRGIVLDQGTSMSGGRLEHLLSSMSLQPSLDRVAADLEQQYHVVYGRPGTLVPPKKIEVSVTRPGVKVRWTPAATPPRPSSGE